MKKRLCVSLLLALSLLMSFTLFARAETQLDYVNDYAAILTDSERQSLNGRARQISEQYDCGVYVVVVNDFTEFVNGNIAKFSEEIFHGYKLGWGESENGVLLAMSMKERDFDIYAHGNFGNYAFTDYGKGRLADSILDDFRHNDWSSGFRDYIDNSGEMMRRAKAGDPVDIQISDPARQGPGFSIGKLLASLGIGCFVGGTSVGGMKRKLKTAVKQTRAANYVAQGGVSLRGKRDDFVNRTVTRRPIPRATTSGNRPGGHPGGTTISGSHGGSHHSGKF